MSTSAHRSLLVFLSTVFTLLATEVRAQTRLKVGDIIDPQTISLCEFDTTNAINLADYAGKILYLEWFYWW